MIARKVDPPKVCQAPSCGKSYHRKPGETRQNFVKRSTCGADSCIKEVSRISLSLHPLRTYQRSDDSFQKIPKGDVACANCHYIRENSELGKHCGPCHNGSAFLSISRVVARKTTEARL